MEPHEVIAATVAVYPLQSDPDRGVRRSIDALDTGKVSVEVGPMTTLVTGTVHDMFGALRCAYDAAASTGPVVMTVTVSNACPIPSDDGDRAPRKRR